MTVFHGDVDGNSVGGRRMYSQPIYLGNDRFIVGSY